MTNALVIASSPISTDAAGRYCLNDLHKAAGGAPRHRPNYFLDRVEIDELRSELKKEYEEKAGIPAIQSKQGLGTYVCKELVYAYAMWISPKFHIQVIRAYDALVTGKARPAHRVVDLVVPEHGELRNLPEPRAKRLAEWFTAPHCVFGLDCGPCD